MAKQPIDTGTPAAEPTAAEVRAALERILHSQCFAHAGRASDFLRFVVAETLAGGAERLKGYTIAVSVFGRPPDFDAQADPLVRVEALRLRQRLTEYYSGEGAADRVKIELPRGGYAVKAVYAGSEPAPSATEPSAPAAHQRATWLGARTVWVAAALALVVTTGILALQRRGPIAEQTATDVAPDGAHRTKIVVVPLENLSGKR